MPLYLWCAALFISLVLAFTGMKLGKRGRVSRALWSFMPLILALPFASLSGMVLELMSDDPDVIILTVPVFATFSLLFEALLNGKESLKALLPFFLTCTIVGALIELSGIERGYGDYSGLSSLANVILFGYVLFFYFAVKISSAIRTLVGRW